MKTSERNIIYIGIVIVAALWITGGLTQFGFPGPNLNTGGGGSGGAGGIIDVNKPVRFTVIDKYGGSAMASQTLSVYDTDYVLHDTLTTDANGQDDTNAAWLTGSKLWCHLVGSTGERKWIQVTVPGQSEADANSLTINPVSLEFYDYSAPTLGVRDQAGNALTDAGTGYNKTTTGSTAVITVSWFQGTTGNGYMDDFDPIYGIKQDAVLVLKLSNTNYDLVGVTGMDGGMERASARYFYHVIPATELCKWQVGADFRLVGTGSHTFTLDLSGYSGDLADADLYIYYFGNWNYYVENASFGPNALSVIAGSPFTLNLID